MLRTTIQTTDRETGKELLVSADLLTQVQRAADSFRDNLTKVADKFNIEANWRFTANPDAGLYIELQVSVGSSHDTRTHTFSLARAVFEDDISIRRGLYGPLTWLGQEMAALVEIDFARIRRQLQQDLESLATIREE